MGEIKALTIPNSYIPFHKVFVCGNSFENGQVLFKVGKAPIILIGKGETNTSPKTWLSIPSGHLHNDRRWRTVIDEGEPKSKEFEINHTDLGSEILYKGIPLVQFHVSDDVLFITMINLTPVGLNITGGYSALSVSNSTLESNTFNSVETMVQIG